MFVKIVVKNKKTEVELLKEENIYFSQKLI